jgi:ribosomal protein S18 acetylase RimI-like enzyme
MTELVFREAVAADLPAIVAMLADDYLGAGREDASLPLQQGYSDAFKAIEAMAGQHLFVLEAQSQVIGTVQLSLLPGLSHKGMWRCQLEGVRIASSATGQGYGRFLIEQALAFGKAKGCEVAQLTSTASRERAQAFYEKLGFEKSHVGMKIKL